MLSPNLARLKPATCSLSDEQTVMNERQVQRLELLRARFSAWLVARNYSPRTRPDYDRYVRDFLTWLTRHTSLASPAKVTPAHLQQYQLALCCQPPHGDKTSGKVLSISAQICRLAAVVNKRWG